MNEEGLRMSLTDEEGWRLSLSGEEGYNVNLSDLTFVHMVLKIKLDSMIALLVRERLLLIWIS